MSFAEAFSDLAEPAEGRAAREPSVAAGDDEAEDCDQHSRCHAPRRLDFCVSSVDFLRAVEKMRPSRPLAMYMYST